MKNQKLNLLLFVGSLIGSVSTQSWTKQELTTPALTPQDRLLQYGQCSCQSRYASDSPYSGCSRCRDGCFKARQGRSTFICRRCLPNCESCTNPYRCNVCDADHFLTPGGNACEPCRVPNCESCASPYRCNVCETGHYMTPGGTACEPCRVPHCSVCHSPGSTCSVCDRYYFSASATYCEPCLPHCAECNSRYTCQSCELLYRWNPSRRACLRIPTSEILLYVTGFVTFCYLCCCLCWCCDKCEKNRSRPQSPPPQTRTRVEESPRGRFQYPSPPNEFGGGSNERARDGEYVIGGDDRYAKPVDGGYTPYSVGYDDRGGGNGDYVVGDEDMIASDGYDSRFRDDRGRGGDYIVSDEDRIGRDGDDFGSRDRGREERRGGDYIVGDEDRIGANGY